MNEVAKSVSVQRQFVVRFVLLLAGSVIVPIPIALASANGLISPRALGFVLIAYVACVAIAVISMYWNAWSKLRADSTLVEAPDDAMRTSYRRKIRRLQFGVAFFSFFLIAGLWESRGGPWPPRLVGATMNVLFQVAMIQSIKTLRRRLNQGISSERQ
jgi:hypothetical protein